MKILAIEDNAGDVFLLKFYLEEIDPEMYNIENTDRLADAIQRIEQNNYDMVLLDLHLPDSSGLITLEEILKLNKKIPIIVLTGLADESIGLEAVRMGAQDFLVKGRFDGKALDSSIQYAHQRFQLNTQITTLSDEATEVNGILDDVMEMNDIGFFWIDENTDMVEISRFLRKRLNLEKLLFPLEQFYGMFELAQIKALYADFLASGNVVTNFVTDNLLEQDVKIRIKRIEGPRNILGTVQFV